jgi:methylaspartate ammonia-lyase
MQRTVIAVLIALLAAVLVLTNPDREAFAMAYADRLNEEVADQLGLQGPLGELLGGVTQSALEAAIAQQARRTDYLVASVYTLPAAGEDLRVLGVLGQFVRLGGGG